MCVFWQARSVTIAQWVSRRYQVSLFVIIDFHTHTTASDGALSPRELLERARAAGVRQLAITDHDTVAGYLAAAAYYTHNPGQMRLVAGIEFSCRWSATTVHIVGLGMACDHPAMRQGLKRMARARLERARKISDRLQALGFPGALAGALDEAGDSQVGRPHFAAWLLAQGHVRNVGEAFDKYLGAGKPGDVKAFWPELEEAVQWIVMAGGIAVIAHPLKYRFTRMKLRRLVADFLACGGTGLEVRNGHQNADDSDRLIRLALEFGLVVSAGSDFHRDGDYTPSLGVDVSNMGALEGAWLYFGEPAAVAKGVA
jgi:predicted metal-dependent phosphoesterase TrpH